MKINLLLLLTLVALTASTQDKPRVFVQGKGSENVSSNAVPSSALHPGFTWVAPAVRYQQAGGGFL